MEHYSSGVGYIEHSGTVNGTVAAALQFETAQINDVLKSLIVYDNSGGTVRTVTYPANDPVSRTLRSFEVNLFADPPLADILRQIRGTRVTVSLADETITGAVLGVEETERTVGHGDDEKIVKTPTVNIITDDGIRSVALPDIRKFSILDDKIRKEMNEALAALVQARDQSKKTVTIRFDGNGERHVGMGYLVETPVWKSSYRLMLPDAKTGDTADLQAWAIVENQTDNDWTDVSLSIVGGRPISYIELLYQPLYVSRPVISPDLSASLLPQTYDNGLSLGGENANVQAPRLNLQSLTDMGGGGAFGDTGKTTGGFGGLGGNRGGTGLFSNGGGIDTSNVAAGAGIAGGSSMADFTRGVSAIADATKIGQTFHFTVDHVSLPRQQSSMIPIIAQSVKVDRISIYSPTVSEKFAMRGLRLHNDTGKYLLGGPVTVMESAAAAHSYAGDAKIEDIPPGQSRLLSYAIDQDTLIQVSPDLGDEALITGTMEKGVLWLKYRSDVERTYTLQNKGDVDTTVILEHPISEGFDLKEPASATEKTGTAYRFEVKLAAKETKTLKVVMEKTRSEQMDAAKMEADPITFYISQKEIPQKVRDTLKAISGKRAALTDIEQKIQVRTADRTELLQEEANLRENIKVLPAGSASQEKDIQSLSAREADMDAASKDLKDLQAKLDTARSDLSNFLANATVE